jgi:transcriptional regulator with XRE-family HTH domain
MSDDTLNNAVATINALGKAVVLLSASRGLTRKAWAERAGISYPFAAEVENGHKAPSFENLMKICKALEVSPVRLMALIEEIQKDGDVTIPARGT